MYSPPWIALMVVYYMECVLALSLNFWIVVLNGKSLRNGTKQNPSAVIQLIMGVINITMRSLMFLQFTALFCPNLRLEELYLIMLFFLPFQMYISNWLISWLCAFYCISIVNSTYQVFIWVRRTLSSWLPLALILSVIASIALCIPIIWTLKMTQMYFIDNSTHFYTSYMAPQPFSLTYLIISIFLGFCLPFIISSFSLTTTVISLLRHIRNINQQDSGFSPTQVRAHVNAIRTMIFLLLLSVIFCISDITVYNILSLTNLWVIICWIVIAIFPTLEAAIIIQSSSRLSKMVLGRLCAGRAVEAES